MTENIILFLNLDSWEDRFQVQYYNRWLICEERPKTCQMSLLNPATYQK